MRSAFGIEHGEVSKGIPAGLRTAASGKQAGYAAQRLRAHKLGRQAAKDPGQKYYTSRTATPMQAGHWARRSSRDALR